MAGACILPSIVGHLEVAMETIPVMLIDDNPVFLRATAQFLEAQDDIVVVGTASRGDEALEKIEQWRTDVNAVRAQVQKELNDHLKHEFFRDL